MVLRETRAQKQVAVFSVTEQVFSKVGVGPLCYLFPYPGLGVTLPTGPAAPQTSHPLFLRISTACCTQDWANKGALRLLSQMGVSDCA